MVGQRTQILHCAALTCTILVAFTYFVPPPSPENFGTNTSVRFYLTKSLALDRSFAIEKYYLGGIDAAYYQGHYYSGKAPATSFLAVPVYWVAWHTIGSYFALPDWIYLYLVQVCVIALPSVLMALLLHGFLCRFVPSEWYADLLVIGYSLGTMAFPYSTQFVGHQLAAVLLFGCFMVLLKWRRVLAFAISPTSLSRAESRGRFARSSLLVAGVLGGLAVASDYQVALILLIIVIFMLVSMRRFSDILIFGIGCIPGIFLVLLYNHACFGNVLSFPYAHEAMPIAKSVQSQGFFGVKMPKLVPFLMLLFSSWRGLFFVSPFLILSVPGFYFLFRGSRGDDVIERATGASERNLFWISLLCAGGYLLFNSSYEAWSGGSGYGPRFLVPVIPFLLIPIAYLMARNLKDYGWLLALLVLYSVTFHCVGTAAGPVAHEYLRNPVREFLLPSVLRGNIRPNLGTLAGLSCGASAVLFAVSIAAGIILFLSTGERGKRVSQSIAGPAARLWWWLSSLAFLAMVGLFVFHRTEESAYRYAVIGHSYDYSGDREAAIPYFEKSLQMDPLNPLVLNDLTAILIERGEYRKSLEIHLRALAVRPEDPATRARAALLTRIVDVSSAIASSPRRQELLIERAVLIDRLGCSGAATRERERAYSGIAGAKNSQPD